MLHDARRVNRTIGGLVLGGLALAACERPPDDVVEPDFEARYVTDRLRIGTAFEAEICAGSLSLMEAHAAWVDRELGETQDEPSWVELYAEDQQIPPKCDQGDIALRGCWNGGAAYALADVSTSHELVHARAAGVNREPLDFLEEGLAVRMQGTAQKADEFGRMQVKTYMSLPVEELGKSVGSYGVAGHFVHWLVEQYGGEALTQVYRRSRRGMTEESLSQLFEDAFGSGLEKIVDLYIDTASDLYPGVGPYACGGGEALGWEGDRVYFLGELSCSDPDTLDRFPSEDSPETWRRFRLEVPADGIYHVKVSGAAGTLMRCLSAPTGLGDVQPVDWPVLDDWVENGHPLVRQPELMALDASVELASGVYDLWVGQPRDESLPGYSIEIQPQ